MYPGLSRSRGEGRGAESSKDSFVAARAHGAAAIGVMLDGRHGLVGMVEVNFEIRRP